MRQASQQCAQLSSLLPDVVGVVVVVALLIVVVAVAICCCLLLFAGLPRLVACRCCIVVLHFVRSFGGLLSWELPPVPLSL